MTTDEMMGLATLNAPNAQMASSAKLCLSRAETMLANGNEDGCRRLLVDSLRYSLGIFHPDYKAAHAAWVYGLTSAPNA